MADALPGIADVQCACLKGPAFQQWGADAIEADRVSHGAVADNRHLAVDSSFDQYRVIRVFKALAT